MADTRARSPLESHTPFLAGAAAPAVVRVSEVPFRAQVGLRLDPKSAAAGRVASALEAALPGEPGEVVVARDLTVLWLGPDEWLVIGPQDAQERIQAMLNSALGSECGAVVDLSAHRTIVEVAGPRAAELLNKGCSLDLHPRAFPVGRCASTLLARAQVVLVCQATDEPRYWVLVRSSFARYLSVWLVDAAVEYRVSREEAVVP